MGGRDVVAGSMRGVESRGTRTTMDDAGPKFFAQSGAFAKRKSEKLFGTGAALLSTRWSERLGGARVEAARFLVEEAGRHLDTWSSPCRSMSAYLGTGCYESTQGQQPPSPPCPACPAVPHPSQPPDRPIKHSICHHHHEAFPLPLYSSSSPMTLPIFNPLPPHCRGGPKTPPLPTAQGIIPRITPQRLITAARNPTPLRLQPERPPATPSPESRHPKEPETCEKSIKCRCCCCCLHTTRPISRYTIHCPTKRNMTQNIPSPLTRSRPPPRSPRPHPSPRPP